MIRVENSLRPDHATVAETTAHVADDPFAVA